MVLRPAARCPHGLCLHDRFRFLECRQLACADGIGATDLRARRVQANSTAIRGCLSQFLGAPSRRWPNWIATGDAALAFDPLSGQGVLKSIETGTRCAAAIARYFAGDSSALAAYDSWVQKTYQACLSERRRFYSGVLRWASSQFWKRRQSSDERKYSGTIDVRG